MSNFNYLLQNSTSDEVLKVLSEKLDNSDEANFWKERIIPYVKTILTLLMPLQEQKLLFTPEGEEVDILNDQLFFRWADLVCLRVLYFIIKQSNERNELLRTKHKNKSYKFIDIEEVENYLVQNKINITDEDSLDFPVATYNLHIGVNSIIKNLFSK